MASNLYLFEILDRDYFSKVRFGDGILMGVKGKGARFVQTSSGTKLIFDMLFVLEISHHLLSVGQLLDKDYSFKRQRCDLI